MSDKYNNWLPKLLMLNNGCDYYAITLNKDCTRYSHPKEFVDAHPNWRKHEEKHKLQWAKEKDWKMYLKYIYFSFVYGYDGNPYEKDAGPIQ